MRKINIQLPYPFKIWCPEDIVIMEQEIVLLIEEMHVCGHISTFNSRKITKIELQYFHCFSTPLKFHGSMEVVHHE